MNQYDMMPRRLIVDEADELTATKPIEPFKMLIDEEARKAVLERAMVHQPTRGHRNPIKAVPSEMDA
mgnify:CR=1 FL=1